MVARISWGCYKFEMKRIIRYLLAIIISGAIFCYVASKKFFLTHFTKTKIEKTVQKSILRPKTGWSNNEDE